MSDSLATGSVDSVPGSDPAPQPDGATASPAGTDPPPRRRLNPAAVFSDILDGIGALLCDLNNAHALWFDGPDRRKYLEASERLAGIHRTAEPVIPCWFAAIRCCFRDHLPAEHFPEAEKELAAAEAAVRGLLADLVGFLAGFDPAKIDAGITPEKAEAARRETHRIVESTTLKALIAAQEMVLRLERWAPWLGEGEAETPGRDRGEAVAPPPLGAEDVVQIDADRPREDATGPGADAAGRGPAVAEDGLAASNRVPPFRFIQRGAVYEVAGFGESGLIPALKGTRDIVRLLRSPGQRVSMFELDGRLVAGPNPSDARSRQTVLDTQARSALASEIARLTREVEDARAEGDAVAEADSRSKLDELLAHRGAAVGIGGRDRDLNSEFNKLRTKIANRLRTAIVKIGSLEMPEVARHFERAIRAEEGAFIYDPGPEVPAWAFESEELRRN